MFALRAFPTRFFPVRYFPKIGGIIIVVGATPAERSAFITADDRSARVLTEVRSAFIPADDRTARVRL